ncbi:uncharacterized protein N7525_009413, partial [Penicillium rubens]|uniref:uncharacterized protein n=1 Tax=Penicillium rubens TaxID=1108849 RepID=UPI002A5995F2
MQRFPSSRVARKITATEPDQSVAYVARTAMHGSESAIYRRCQLLGVSDYACAIWNGPRGESAYISILRCSRAYGAVPAWRALLAYRSWWETAILRRGYELRIDSTRGILLRF